MKLRLLMLLSMVAFRCGAQYTFYKSKSYLELSGYITSYYNYRFYQPEITDHKKNRFALDYAVLKIDGTLNKVWNYQLELNNAALFDPETNDGFMMQATVAYNTLRDNLSVELGYDKLPFTHASMVANTESPFLQRAEVARGETFNRRDLGVTATYSLLNKKLVLYAGAYTGMGSGSLAGDNDESGNLEYAARAELSFPARYRHTDLDLCHLNLPLVAIGADGRYAEKKTATGADYGILTIDGKKKSYSVDVRAAYKGITAQVEMIRLEMTPNDTLLLLSKPTDYFRSGGFIAQLNYYFIPLKSVFAIRFDEYNQNDLYDGDLERTLSFAYNYLFDGARACLKLHYMKRLKDPDASEVWTDDQLRIALQLMF